MVNNRYQLYQLKNIPTANFTMTALELKDYLDFEVKRIYLISSAQGEYKTGQHAHRKDEDELFVQVQGSSTITLDDGAGKKQLKLEGGKHAINVPHLVWHGFTNLSSDCIILALSSTNYDRSRSDYCEDYQEFQELVKNG